MVMATLGPTDGLVDFHDIHTQEGNEILLEYLDRDGAPVGVAWGFNALDSCTYEILDFTEPTGAHIRTVFGDRRTLHEDTTAMMTVTIVTEDGEFPITILQHGSSRADTTGRWIREVCHDAWVSIL